MPHTPEQSRAYRNRPEVKARMLERRAAYLANPEVKAYIQEQTRQYRQQHKDRLREYHVNRSRSRRMQPDTLEIERGYQRSVMRKRAALMRSLKTRPCEDCKVQYPPHVMHFDHIQERGPKKFNLGAACNRSVKNILEEAEKCEVVCANCHAERTYQRRLLTLKYPI